MAASAKTCEAPHPEDEHRLPREWACHPGCVAGFLSGLPVNHISSEIVDLIGPKPVRIRYFRLTMARHECSAIDRTAANHANADAVALAN